MNPSRMGIVFTSKTHHDTYAEINPAVNPAPCAGKTVLVTGAAKGIGRAIVISYARAGASRIAIAARGDASATRARALQAAADAGRQGLEILVLRLDPLGISDMDEWWRTWEVNVRGVYWVVRALLPLLLRSADKTIVNLTSVGALALTPGASAYQPSKMAVMRLTEYLMVDYMKQGLLAYSVHPASVPTDLASRMPDAIVKGFDGAAVCHDTPELAGDTIVYLTRKRRDWLAGRYVSCTWDMPEFMAREPEIVEKDLLKLQVTFGIAISLWLSKVSSELLNGPRPG
ncbi:hypothetical protein DL768_010931 [Monosporascus sp. mg162]|nr:hypothetical protein DL768_010931 [Monosporascus sp. mg162]